MHGLGNKSIATIIVSLNHSMIKWWLLLGVRLVLWISRGTSPELLKKFELQVDQQLMKLRHSCLAMAIYGFILWYKFSPLIESAHEDGTVLFQDGSIVLVDVIVHCTGYKYHFPFLQTKNPVTVDDNCVGPLYKHIFPPSLAPFLSFVGIPWKVVPFPLVELQSKWVAAILSGRISLPTPEEMMEDVKALYSEIEAMGWPKRYTHNISYYQLSQFEYDDWLATECGYPPIEEWRKQMYDSTNKNRKNRPESYRDEWDDGDLIALAHQDFQKYL